MFCPKCATQNIDGASFCRVCGANISLVPQALTGQLPRAERPDGLYYKMGRRGRHGRDRDRGPLSLERGIVNVFLGLGFIAAALAVMLRFPGGFTWGWTFFIPAFSCLGRGVAAIVALRTNQQAQLPANYTPPVQFNPPVPENARPGVTTSFPRRNTGELLPSQPSVTEGTTRHLGTEAPTRHLDPSGETQN